MKSIQLLSAIVGYLLLKKSNFSKSTILTIILTGLLGAIASEVHAGASTYTWTGTVSSEWNLAGNWSAGGPPTAADNAIIPVVATNYPVISVASGTVACRDFTINAGATVTQTGGTFQIAHDWRNSGTFNATGGTVQFVTASAGGGATWITATSNQFFNVIINSGIDPGFDNDNNGVLSVAGNWTDNNTGALNIAKSYTITFNGSSNQTITTARGTNNSFHNIVFNKSSNGVTLASPARVATSATFTSGEVTTDATNLLIFIADATTSASSNTSFVNGPVRKIFDNSALESFTFPIGKTGIGNEHLTISGVTNVATNYDFTAEYIRSSAASLGGVTAPVLNVSNCDYWALTKNAGNAAGVSVTLSWDASSGCNATTFVTDPSSLTVAHFTGPNWDQAGTAGSFTGTAVSGTVTRSGVTVFSPFALGNKNAAQNPLSPLTTLPIRMGDIKGYSKIGGIAIDWNTFSESNMSHFEIERSSNGSQFMVIGQTTARNNNDKSEYGWLDNNPFSSNNFYRIKAVDQDNKFTYSSIVRINLDKTSNQLTIYPNPVIGRKITFQASDLQKGNYDLIINNSMGQQVYKMNLTITGGAYSQTIQLPASLQSGLYQMQITNNEYKISKPLLLIQ